jgi:hypothetical protein
VKCAMFAIDHGLGEALAAKIRSQDLGRIRRTCSPCRTRPGTAATQPGHDVEKWCSDAGHSATPARADVAGARGPRRNYSRSVTIAWHRARQLGRGARVGGSGRASVSCALRAGSTNSLKSLAVSVGTGRVSDRHEVEMRLAPASVVLLTATVPQ